MAVTERTKENVRKIFYCVICMIVEIDISEITTNSLKELLKVEREELYDVVLTEVRRREDLTSNCSSIPATSKFCCLNVCIDNSKTCQNFCTRTNSEDHYRINVTTKFDLGGE